MSWSENGDRNVFRRLFAGDVKGILESLWSRKKSCHGNINR